ncbi:hypothetical protein ATO12_22650 [Aquimarina atlantica]|uniref:Ig-like domain-containing protein n=1 Tax=Aquimarina atlantica TaxID=1317122 RepID=A0A023BQB0_9FLAO|nr:T9SS type B sorting domain-containing protein [Aquimarina atlantica]EZH72255.1 hypothetical protein ATO12_22650 [Aquimarina atlantica]
MKLRLKSAIVLVFLMIGIQLSAQVTPVPVPFQEVPNSTLRINGELKIIGNAITGLNQSGFTPNDSYNGNASNNRKFFGYIDIDGDPSTFSSSSADLQLNGSFDCERIAYAGLYWAASYFDTDAFGDVIYDNLPVPDTRPDFRTIKIKHQSQAAYTTITPAQTQVIYNGYPTVAGNTAETDIQYVCYADVTTLLQGIADPSGTYTIADMRASTGFSGFGIVNGISSGWVLVVVYEDPSLSAKFISTRSGFLNNQPCNPADPGCLKNFTYTGFQTLPAPLPVRARYSVAALEGDRPFTGDIFQIERPDGVRQNIFTTPANPNNNFFDSSISVDGSYGNAAAVPIPGDPPIREPHSRNTLGFDADIFNIPNPNNTVIPNTPPGNTASTTFYTTSTNDAYSVFFSSFQIEVIEPELTVKKRVLDVNGVDITGDPVNFADQLFYELTIENQGNENITTASIRDVLPDNVDFTLGSITTSPGIVATPNGTNRQIDITIDDALVVRNGGEHTVRFGVSVVATCADLRDACSNQITNVAISTYTGVDSGILKDGEESILEQDVCKRDIIGTSNVLINDGICFTTAQPAFICTGSLTLTAGAGFSSYEWVNASSPGVVIGTNRDLVVTTAGTYIVTETGAPGCQDAQQTFNVDAFNTVTNPLETIANNLASNPNVNGNVRTCPITGDPLPEIFLCGAGTTLTIPLPSGPGNTLGFPVGTTVEWQRLDPAACPAVPRDPNCPTTDAGCDGDWVTLSTDINSFTISQAGEYRVNATFDSNCTIPFYFNVFQNNFDPDLTVVRQIICGTPGTIRVQNSSLQYEYQLITPITNTVIGYQASAEFTGLTEVGTYTVNVRQVGGLPTACVFQETVFLDELDATETVTPTSPTCPGDQGQIQISVTDSQINYTYIINSTTTAFNDTEGPTTVPNHTFTGLNPDTYNVQVLSADGSCSEPFTVTINDPAAFSATIRLVEDLHCNPNYQPDISLPDYDPDQFIAIYEVTVTGGSGNFAFNNQADFLGTVLAPITGTTYQFRATTAGNYPVFVNDLDNSCTIAAGSVDVSPYTAITATATAINPACNADSGSIQVTIGAGATGPFTYILNQGTASEVTIGPTVNTTETFNNVDPSVSHTVTVQDGFGCDFTVTPNVTFTTPASITATINDDFRLLSCTATPGAQAQVTAINGGSGTYEWSLNPAGPFTAVGAIPFEIDFATDGSYTLYIRNQATDDCLTPFPITIDPRLEVDSVTITPGDQDCSNQTVDVVVSALPALTAPAFYEYSITPDPATGTGATGTTAFSTTIAYTFTNGVLYTVTARRSDTQCVNTESFTGTTVPEIQITSASQDKPVNCVGGSDGILSFTVGNSAAYTYTVTGPTAVPAGAGAGVTPVTIGSLSAGTYTITVTDTSLSAPSVNCSTTTTVDITEPTDPLSFDPFGIDAADCGNPTGFITVNVTGGRGGYEYQLRDAAGVAIITPYQSSNVFGPLADGTYTVFVRDGSDPATACEINQQVVVPVTVAPSIALATGGDVCYDTTNQATQRITITLGVPAPVGPFTYSLDGGAPVAVVFLPGPAPANTFEIPNLTPGAHTVTVTNTGSTCTSNTENFTINPELTITANLDKDVDCNSGASISYTATGGDGTYTFNLVGPAPQSGIANPVTGITTPGTYQIEVEDGLGCTALSNTITVNAYEALAGNLVGTDPACPADNGEITVNATAGEGPFTYILDGAITFGPTSNVSHTFNGVDPTVPHNVIIRDRFNCELPLGPISLTPPAAISATIDDDFRLLSCTATPGAQAQVTGIAGGSGTYEWSLNAAGPFTAVTAIPFEIDFATDGTYTLYIRNQATDDCVESFPITIDPRLEVDDITFVTGDSDCSAQTIEVTATAAPVGPTYTYSVVPAPVSGNATTGVFVLNRAVTYTFTATRGDNQCSYSENYRQELVPEIQITNAVETSPTTCIGGSDGALSFTVGNSANFTYTITGPIAVPGGAGVGVTPVNVGSLEAGVYTITVTDSNLAGGSPPNCQATTTVTITQPDPITFTIDPVVQDCAADTNTVTISAVSGGSGAGYTYVLNDSGGTPLGASRPVNQPYNNVPNATGYEIIVTDGAGCTSPPQTFDINQLPQLDASVNTGSDFCLDDGTVSFTIDIDGTDSGTPDYTYNVTRSGVVVIPDTNVGALTTFTTTPALTLPGDYVITITDSNGCPVVLPTQTIEPAVELVVTQVADITCDALGNPVNASFSFAIPASNPGYTPYTIDVSFNAGPFTNHLTAATAPFANYTATSGAGDYTFRVTDARGCTFTTNPFTVTDPVAPTIADPDVDLACAGDTGTVVITVTGTETPYEIDFNGAGFVTITGTQISFPNLAGDAGDADPTTNTSTYNYTVRSSRGCLYPGSVDVNQPALITEVNRVETPVTCGGSPIITDLGAIDFEIAGGTANYTYTLVTAANFAVRPLVPATTAATTPNPVTTGTTVRFEGLDFGQYFIFVTDANGCTDNAPFGPFDIFSPPNDLVQNITISATCPGGVIFDIDVQGGSGIDGSNPPPGFDIRIVGETGPNGVFQPLNDDPLNATVVDATTPIRIHRYGGANAGAFDVLDFNRTYILEVRDNATNCLYQEIVPPVAPPSSPNIINDVVTDVSCNPSPDDGTLNFDVSGYDASVTEISWEVFNAFTNVSLGAAYTGSNAGLTGADTSVSITGLPPGQFYVTVREVDGTMCPARHDFTIDMPDPLTSVATNQTPANGCGTNAQVIMDTDGGTLFAIPPTADGYRYALIADDGFGAPVTTPTLLADFPLTSNVIDLGNNDTEVQHIFVIDDNGCTFGPVTVTTVANPLPTIVSANFIDDCAYDNSNVIRIEGGGLGTLTYQLDGGTAVVGSINNNNHEFTVSTPGTYTIGVTDETGCTVTTPVDVYGPLQISAAFTVAPDCTNPTGTITTTTTSGTIQGTATYVLQDSGGTPTGNVSGVANGIFLNVAPGSYIVEITDDGRGTGPAFCSFTAPVSIEEPTLPVLLAQPNTSVTCNGDTDGVVNAVLDPATEDLTATYQYEIIAPIVVAPQASPQFTGLGAGTYTVRVTATEANGALSVLCTADRDYTIDNPSVITATGTAQDPLTCGAGNTVSAGTIAITIDATTGTGPDYFVTVTQPDGVVRTRIPVPTPIPAPPATALLIAAPVDGVYNITVFDTNNCSLVLPPVPIAPLPVMTDPTVTAGTPIDCATNVQPVTVSITGGTGPFDFVETSGAVGPVTVAAGIGNVDPPPGVQTIASFNLPGVGNYVFEITDTATGCTIQTPSFNVPEYDTIEATIAPLTNITCVNDLTAGEVTLTVTGYTGTYDFTVTNATTGTSTNGTGDTTVLNPITISNLEAGDISVVVTATAAPLSCNDTSNIVTISAPAPLTLNPLSRSTPDCNNPLSVVTMEAGGGVGPYNFAAEAGTLVPGPPPATPGVFALTDTFSLDPTISLDWVIYVRDANGCIVPTQIAIPAVTAPPTLNPIPLFVDDACNFDNNYTFTVTATSNVPAPGTGNLTYQLNMVTPVATVGPQVPGSVNNNTHEFTVTAPGTYRVFVYDENGCPSASQDITVYPELLVTATLTEPTCRDNDATIVATVSGGSDITANPGNFTFDLVDAGTGTTIPGVTQTAGPGADQITFSSTTPGTDGIFPGDYRVEVNDSAIGPALPAPGGCPATFNITVPTFLDPIPSGTSTPVSCFNGTDGTILVSLDPTADDNPSYQYEIVAGPVVRGPQPNPLFENLPAGTYDIVVTSDKGCSNTPAIQVVVGGPTAILDASGLPGSYTCNATNDPVSPIIIVTIIGGTAPYDVSYTGPSSSGSETDVVDSDGNPANGVQYGITAPVAGTYTISVVDNNNCAVANFDVIQPAFPVMSNPTVNAGPAIDCNTNTQDVTVTITGGVGPFNFVETTGVIPPDNNVGSGGATTTSTTFTLPGLPTPGSYIFEIFDIGTGCSILTPQYDVPVYDTIEATIALGNDITCFNTVPADGSVVLTVTGYTGAYSYNATNTTTGTVTPGVGNTATGTHTIAGLEAGNIQVVVTATATPFCSTPTNTIAITQPPVINLSINQIQDETCNPGGDATIEAVAGGGTGALQYQLEDTVGAPLVPFGSDPRFGGYQLDGGAAPAGIDYVVRVRDARGCEVTDTINIQPPTALGLTAIAPILLDCSDSEDGTITAIATDGQGPGTYLFMLTFPDGSQSGAIASTTDRYVWNDLKPGNYIVTVTDNLACEIAQDPVIINAPPAVTIDVAQGPISCLTPSPNPITVTAGGGTPGGYEFSSDGTTFVAGNTTPTTHTFNLPAGDYNFYVRDINGCVSPASNTIPVRDPVPLSTTLDLSNTSIVCFGEPTGSIDASVTGGLGNYGYRVTGTDYLGNSVTLPGPLATDTQTTSFFGDLRAGSYTYTVTSGDCVDSVTPFNIDQPLELDITVSATPISCNGETDGSIHVEINRVPPPSGPRGGTNPYFYSLYDSAGNAVFVFLEDDIDGASGEHTFIDLPADTYRVEVEDGKGCPVEETNIIIIEPAPILATVNATTPEDCAGDMNGTATLSITGGLPPANPADPSYFWSIDGVTYQPVTDPANLFIDNLPGGTTTVFIRDSQNNANCQGAFNIDIEPGVNLAGELVPELVCPVFDYSDPMNPVMTSEEQYFVSFDIVEESQGLGIIYTLNGINGTPNPPNNSNLTGNFEVTPGEYEGIMEYQGCTRTVDTIEILEYTPLAIPVAQMTNNPQDPNEYRIIASGGRPFENTPFYAFSFTMLEEGMTLDQLEPSDYTELDGDIFVIRQTADYVLRVVDADGCEVLTVQNLTYINIRIPNYFTPDSPNSTAEDRFWYPRQITPNVDDPFFFENMEVIVFDRYGRMLAEFKGDQQGWDGLYQGKQLPSGDYWYSIILNDVDNREFTGHFTLYR